MDDVDDVDVADIANFGMPAGVGPRGPAWSESSDGRRAGVPAQSESSGGGRTESGGQLFRDEVTGAALPPDL
eukprot:4197446-Alexandrium_andersonii.AAC.1